MIKVSFSELGANFKRCAENICLEKYLFELVSWPKALIPDQIKDENELESFESTVEMYLWQN